MRASTEKTDRASPGKGYDQCEYEKMVESGPVPGSGRIRASTEILSGRVSKNSRISVRTLKW